MLKILYPITKIKLKPNKTLTDFRNIDKIISLEGDMIVKVDRTSMLASLECRALLNKEIWNFTSQLEDFFNKRVG
jgi:asparagine synthase (glutamine-hydrolysing)